MNSPHSTSRGFTLIELLVGMAIGIIMLLAVSTLYITNREGFRTNSENAAQEDAGRYALNLLARNIRMVGFTNLRTDTAYPTGTISGYLNGCELGYVDPSTSNYACATSTPGGTTSSSSIETRYETDLYNADSSQGKDCIGNSSTAITTSAGSATNIVVNRFFVSRDSRLLDGQTFVVGQLSCSTLNTATSAITPAQPILQGIEQISFRYLVPTNDTAESAAVYKTAADLSTSSTWEKVSAVEICVLTKSIGKNINMSGAAYKDCQGNAIAASNKEIYRLFKTEVGVRINYQTSPLVTP